jgi:hypothetical protein
LNNRLLLRNYRNSGVGLSLNHTWSHAIDNLSSTFFEAGTAGQYGNSNITINNGDLVYGLLDPFHPNLDRGNGNSISASGVTGGYLESRSTGPTPCPERSWAAGA